MNTGATKSGDFFGKGFLLDAQSLKAQMYYGNASAIEKSKTEVLDKVNRLLRSNEFKVKLCKDYHVLFSDSIRVTSSLDNPSGKYSPEDKTTAYKPTI